jgi:Ca2+-binding RTX toxin-like protein
VNRTLVSWRVGRQRAGLAVVSFAMLLLGVATGPGAAYAAEAGITVSVEDTGVPLPLGGPDVDFIITVETGGTAATDVVTVTRLTGMPVSVTRAIPNHGSCSVAGAVVTCALGTLGPLTIATVVISATPAAVGVLTATTVATLAEADPDPADNTAVATIEIYDLYGCTILGTVGDDVLRGTNGPDVICAFGGQDRIMARGGADSVYAGSGDDLVEGGPGDDALDGGLGDDTVRGGPGDDFIEGRDGNDVLNGNAGDDTVNGGGDNDVVAGDNGRDRVETADTVGGNDVADGGAGVDACVIDFGDTLTSCEVPG